jgi:outer membrane protein assembly factor BamB
MMTNRRLLIFAIPLLAFIVMTGCRRSPEVWRYDLGETLKVQTVPLTIPEKELVVTWKVLITKDETAEGRYVIPKVRRIKSGIAMELEKKRFQAVLVALDEKSGEVRWETDPLGESDQNLSSPVYDGGSVFVGSDSGHVYEIDASSGEILWSADTGGWVTAAPMATDRFIAAGNENGRLICWRRNGKRILFEKDFKEGFQSPLFMTPYGFFGAAGKTLFLLDENGALLKEWVSEDKYIDYDGIEKKQAPITSPLSVNKETALFTTQGGYLHLFDIALWEDRLRIYDEELTYARPLAVGPMIAAGTQTGAVLFQRDTGRKETSLPTDHRWMDFDLKFRKGGAVNGGFLLHKGVLYFGSYDYALYGYDTDTWERRFKYAIKHHIDRTEPAMGRHYLIFGADSHHLYAVRPYEP